MVLFACLLAERMCTKTDERPMNDGVPLLLCAGVEGEVPTGRRGDGSGARGGERPKLVPLRSAHSQGQYSLTLILQSSITRKKNHSSYPNRLLKYVSNHLSQPLIPLFHSSLFLFIFLIFLISVSFIKIKTCFSLQTPDGREFSCGSGMTDRDRASPPPVGSVVTFRFTELMDNGDKFVQ